MIEPIDLDLGWHLSDYAAIAHLAEPVRSMRVEASMLLPPLRERTVWMVNSTAQGGGVAEMLPRMVTLLDELGLATRWVVMRTDRTEFFGMTKRLHNLIHGSGNPELSAADRELYEAVNRDNAEALAPHLRPDDIVVIHDPQPMAMGALLKQRLDVRVVWNCHIGLDDHNAATGAAWSFLKPYAEAVDLAIFSAPEYIPDYLAGRATVIPPALDPCSHKNRELSPHKLVGILCNASLKAEEQPVLTPPFEQPARRLQADGSFAPARDGAEIGLLYRPVVTQVSRWDRLKGFGPLLEGFVRLKRSLQNDGVSLPDRHRRCLQLVRLVLAGPDPDSIADDPEGREVLDDLCRAYRGLDTDLQADVALLTLPMKSRKQNALMVNALQRCSTVAVQNSLQEGFGLTATEAMWKRVCVMGSRACGLRHQIRSGIDGVLVRDPTDPDEIHRRLNDILEDVPKRDMMARNAQRHVHDEFLIFTQLCRWLRELSTCVGTPPRRAREDFPTIGGA